MDRFRELSAFVAVVDAGSFVGAGEALRISKAAVSRCVQDLETRLGARLLQRTTRRLSLTEAGRAYYERARQLLADLDEADGAVGAVTGQPLGTLRINAPLSFGVLYLAPLWGEFLSRHPGLELDISLSDRLVDLVDEGYDLAVRITRLQDSSLVSRQLASTRIVMCASPDYLARHGTPTRLADIADHAVIAYSYAHGGDIWRFAGPDGVDEEVVTRPRIRANNGDTCRAAALAGQGIVMQPTFLVGDDLAAGRLQRVLPDYAGVSVGIHAVYPSRKHLSLKVRVLLDYLAEAFATVPWAECEGVERERARTPGQ